jgi:hypothetical protein
VSVVRYTSRKPFVLRLNDVGGDLGGLRPPERPAVAEGDAEIGGGAGPAADGSAPGGPDPVG